MTRDEYEYMSACARDFAEMQRKAHDEGREVDEAIHDAQVSVLLHLILIFKLEEP